MPFIPNIGEFVVQDYTPGEPIYPERFGLKYVEEKDAPRKGGDADRAGVNNSNQTGTEAKKPAL